MRSLGEGASGRVDAKDGDGIGVLIFREKKFAGGIDGEMARFFATGGEFAGGGEVSRRKD